MTFPRDPIAAVTHPDPYPYYADLVARKPVHRDESLGLWVASSADAVGAVLRSDLCRVRPPAEPVPRGLLGSPAADIFRHLVRMNDGPGHCPFKRAVSAALAAIDAARVVELSARWARSLAAQIGPAGGSNRLPEFAFQLPVHVVASLFGVAPEDLPQVARWTDELVGCLAPASSPAQIARGKVAAGRLLDTFRSLPPGGDGLLAALAREARRVRADSPEVLVANGIGLLTQSYEATAGLIGNTLVALASHGEVRERVAADPSLLHPVIQEVLRYDPPIQNTRRFLAGQGMVAGREMAEGDVVLVVLAAANRDPSANPDPHRFDVARSDRRVFAFGAGAHTCPGEAVAATIAQAGVAQLIASGLALEDLSARTYRASANARIPLFTGQEDMA